MQATADGEGTMKLVVFTDLDATLLDPETYSWREAAEALEALKKRDVPLVLVSSKTLAEMAPLHEELGLTDPFVVENGGGLVFPRGARLTDSFEGLLDLHVPGPNGDMSVLSLGTGYQELVSSLAEIAGDTGAEIVGFADMEVQDVARIAGLSREDAAGAKDRLFDEPFLVVGHPDDLADQIRGAAASRGLTAVEGGRFWHLMGHEGKGKAVGLLVDQYRRIFGTVHTIGLGDSPNDFPFLELMDTPVIVGGAHSDHILSRNLRWALKTESPGPSGWNEAILSILSSRLDIRK